jgi:hypothetical protein
MKKNGPNLSDFEKIIQPIVRFLLLVHLGYITQLEKETLVAINKRSNY